MRIVLLQGAFFPVPTIFGGAVEKMWYSLGKEFVRKGHEVFQVSRLVEGLPESEQIDGVRHIRLKGYNTPKSGVVLKFRDLLYTRKVLRVLPTDFDILVSNTFWAPILLSQKAQKVCFVDVQRMPKGQMRLYGATARLRANSTPVADAIRKELPKPLHNRIVMIPNPLPFVPSETIISPKKPIILYVGRVHPEKGLDLLIRAFKQTDQSYQLQIVGPWEVSAGGGGIDYMDKLRKLAGEGQIDFIGPVFDNIALNKFYADASIFVYPSVAERGETFGLAPLEAMAWGCVPVVSNLACFQDFITQGVNGLIFDHRSETAVQQLSNYITQLQNEHALRTQLSENAIHIQQTHSTSHIANLFLEEFQRIVDQTTQRNAHESANS
ncbi:glycosyltransferase family 4 protein [Spirosoma validum]|uniref:Glycosyltransferase family 4 protein n=1 Tax=Spirosoma validum TaxID=2771355 RepID=A0A927B0J7_9BACT|nr:glycosyltransferase family 4 protein [Spirosoma validum]MBD2753304.1 glycosyltransferase family 4 protein [Spirosoma validum]